MGASDKAAEFALCRLAHRTSEIRTTGRYDEFSPVMKMITYYRVV